MCDSRGVENIDPENLSTQETPADSGEPVDKALIARLVVAGIILALFAVFAFQNTESVEIEFLRWSFQLSKFLLMVFSAVAGVVIWALAGAYSRRAKKKQA